MSKIWDIKVKVRCRDCNNLTASITVHNNHTDVYPYCRVQSLNIHPDVEMFCDDFVKCEYSRNTEKVKEREIESDATDVSNFEYKEGHKPKEISEKDIIGWMDDEGNIHPLNETGENETGDAK